MSLFGIRQSRGDYGVALWVIILVASGVWLESPMRESAVPSIVRRIINF